MSNKDLHSPQEMRYELKSDYAKDIRIWLTTKEAAAYLGKSESAFRAFIYRYPVERSYLGSRLRFRREDLDRLMRRTPQKPKGGSS